MSTTISLLGMHDVRELVRPVGPVASVYLGPQQDPVADAELELLLRRRQVARHLYEQGANNATVDAMLGYLAKLPEYSHEYAVFATGDQVTLARHLPGGVDADQAAYAAPAKVAPMLAWLQRHPAYVQVVIDRAGADLTVTPAGARTGLTRTVTGPDDEIRRRFPGGGQLPRMQRRAEDSWLHNAQAVAEAVGEELDRVHADLLLIAGDTQITRLLVDRLHRAGRTPAVRTLPGGRHPNGSNTRRDQAAAEALDAYARQQTAALLARIAQEHGPHGNAVEGVIATLQALAGGLAHTLLIVDDHADVRTAWFGPDLLCATEQPGALGPDRWAQRARLTDIAIRAALLTRAEVHILTPAEGAGLSGGIAALLRPR